tara:strand:+ start:2392 stop:2949 length:558 start_codon:yes stop_codon:yes gene_type:complete
MNDDIKSNISKRMNQAIDHCASELSQIRTGRASTTLLENLKVDYYGVPTPLNSLATITAQEARLLVVQPFDKSIIQDIEKSIQLSELGLNPNNDGTLIRIPIPSLTEERRLELVKIINNLIEESRVSIRNIRKDLNNQVKDLKKNSEISENEEIFQLEEIQKNTDDYITKLNEMQKLKEKELLDK